MSLPLMVAPSLHTFSDNSVGTLIASVVGGSTPASAVYPAANDALFFPFFLVEPIRVKRLFVVNGATVSGNIDVGIYDAVGTRIISAGSTAQSGTSALQLFDVTDTIFSPGRYYWAVAMDNTTGTLFRANLTAVVAQHFGAAKQASGFALPASATLATPTAGYTPVIGAEIIAVY